MTESEPEISEADLVAYADERLEAERRPAVEAWLEAHPEERQRIETWQAQTAALRAVLNPVAAEAVPARLTAALARRRVRRFVPTAIAAVITLAIGLGSGWYAGSIGWPFEVKTPDDEVISEAGIDAHRVYVGEVRHPVEVGVDEEAHLVSWLSKRIDYPIKVPDLSGDGLRLLGGRMVPVRDHPGAQFMYEGENGDRFTLFLARADAPRQTSFRYEEKGGYGSFYWIDGPCAYVLTGPAERVRLLDIARKVYEQTT